LRAAKFGWHSLALLLTGVAWMLPGLLQREPWKADEAYSFGVVYSMIDAGQWLVPTLAGEPFVEKPPLVFWLAALSASLSATPIGDLVAAHEAARLANVALMLLTFGVLALAARRLGLGRAGMSTVILLLAAAPAVLLFSRYLTADLGLFPAAALASLGLISVLRRDRDAGLLLGLGAAMGLMSKGLLLPAALAAAVLLLLALHSNARDRHAWRQYGIALVVFVVLGFAWPLALYLHSPALFETWFWDNNFGRFFGDNRLGPPNDRWHLLAAILTAFLPIWPLAVVAVYRQGLALRQPLLLGPLLFAITWISILMFSHSARSGYALPALVPLALLAAAALSEPSDLFKRKLLRANWPRRLIMAMGGTLLLLIAAAKLFYLFQQPNTALGSTLISKATLALVVALLLAWLLALRAAYRPGILTIWVASLSLAFALAIALFLPGADQKTGFRGLYGELVRHINPHDGCIASRGLGESERAMLHYYTGVQTYRFEADAERAATCPQWIEQQRAVDDASQYGCNSAKQVWSGGRPENTFDVFRVCRR
jgi:4-amino-4-deoxy-L-arabinose transferase-like glycosyltransferase